MSLAASPGGTVLMRRAVGSAYYAIFHALASEGASLLVGQEAAAAQTATWLCVYRALDHGAARRALADRSWLAMTTEPNRTLAERFVEMQAMRHLADYDPTAAFSVDQIADRIDLAEMAVEGWLATPAEERLGFCVRLLFRNRAQAA